MKVGAVFFGLILVILLGFRLNNKYTFCYYYDGNLDGI